MANVLSDTKRQQVLALGRLGWPLRRIEDATGVRRETASAYLKAAGIAIRPPRGWGRRAPAKPANAVSTDSAAPRDPKPANETSTDSATAPWPPRPGRSPRASACAPYAELITDAVARGRNAMAIWQDLVDQHGFAARYASVRRVVRGLRPTTAAPVHPVIRTAPGEEAQVDYGAGAMVRHPETGKYRRTRLFVLTLGYSRKSVRLVVWRSSARTWAELHERAFRRLGGVPRTVVLDNLREGVLTPDVYDPALNPLYGDVLAHYGVVALPCRVRHPDRKGKVESSVGHTQRTPLRGMRFEISKPSRRTSITGRRAGRTRGSTARPSARSQRCLPRSGRTSRRSRSRRFATTSTARASCTSTAASRSTAPTTARPPGYLGQRLPVQWDGQTVRLLDPRTGQLVREHRWQARGQHRIAALDRPTRTPLEVVQLLARATRAGRAIGTLCTTIQQQDGPAGVRRILGVLALAKQHDVPVVEAACAVALDVGVPRYRFVRRYLERHPAGLPTLRQIDPLIRQLTLYRDLLDRRADPEDPT
jgi:transposase